MVRERLADYAGMGARFAKWRAVIGLDGHHPGTACIRANMQALARYAALCQEAGIVAIMGSPPITGSAPSIAPLTSWNRHSSTSSMSRWRSDRAVITRASTASSSC